MVERSDTTGNGCRLSPLMHPGRGAGLRGQREPTRPEPLPGFFKRGGGPAVRWYRCAQPPANVLHPSGMPKALVSGHFRVWDSGSGGNRQPVLRKTTSTSLAAKRGNLVPAAAPFHPVTASEAKPSLARRGSTSRGPAPGAPGNRGLFRFSPPTWGIIARLKCIPSRAAPHRPRTDGMFVYLGVFNFP